MSLILPIIRSSGAAAQDLLFLKKISRFQLAYLAPFKVSQKLKLKLSWTFHVFTMRQKQGTLKGFTVWKTLVKLNLNDMELFKALKNSK